MTYSHSIVPNATFITFDTEYTTMTIGSTTNSNVGIYTVRLYATDGYPNTPKANRNFTVTITSNPGPQKNETIPDYVFQGNRTSTETLTEHQFTWVQGTPQIVTYSVTPA